MDHCQRTDGPRGEIEKLVYISNMQRAELYIRPDALEQYKAKFGDKVPKFAPQFYFIVTDNFEAEAQFEELRNTLPEEQRFKLEIEQRSSYWGRIIDWLLFPVLLILMWVFMFRRMSRGPEGSGGGGGIFNVGRSQAKLFEKDKTVANISFKDVAGLEEAKVEVMEIVDFLKSPEKYTNLGGKIPKGALLVGPPGTGKTLLAKAVAGGQCSVFSILGSDFVEMFVGVGASRVRDLFRQAKEKAPCIVFIDEIDYSKNDARSKNAGFTSNDERENTLNQLLTEMDGFGSNSGVIILAATNRADILDKALMRAGRFDRQIHVDLPELKERLEIFKVHSRTLKLEEGFDLEILAKQTPGFSGADIANVCNEAALIAARKNKKAIQKQDFLDAIDRIVGGLERRSKIISPNEKRTIAYHESGHATVSWMLKHANPLLKVTIIPRGRALGAAWYLPEERQITTVEQMMDEMASALGGRAAEELMIGQISSGAMNDLEKVTRQAYAMVAYLGMSDKIGNVSFYDSTENAGFNIGKPYSETTAQLIDKEVKRIIDQAYDMARKVLKENKEGFLKLATILLEKEVIFADDLETIFGKRQTPDSPPDTKNKDKEEVEHTD